MFLVLVFTYFILFFISISAGTPCSLWSTQDITYILINQQYMYVQGGTCVGDLGMRRFRFVCSVCVRPPVRSRRAVPSHAYRAFRHPGWFGFAYANKNTPPPNDPLQAVGRPYVCFVTSGPEAVVPYQQRVSPVYRLHLAS